jgi:hypothetical protein
MLIDILAPEALKVVIAEHLKLQARRDLRQRRLSLENVTCRQSRLAKPANRDPAADEARQAQQDAKDDVASGEFHLGKQCIRFGP